MERKSIPKKTRFEVFKRDKFTCQYCGAQAPDVVLEIDHIKPVSKGGTNDIMNLVTACKACNSGKTNRELNDDAVIKMQKQRLNELQERREQLQMMLEWRDSLTQEIEDEIDSIDTMLSKQTLWGMSEHGRVYIRKLIKRFGFNETYDACQTAIDQYYDGSEESWQRGFKMIGGICYNKRKEREEDAEQDS